MTCKDGCVNRSKWRSHLDECNSCLGMVNLTILRPLTVSSLLSLWTGVLWLQHLHNASCGICHDWLWLWMKGVDACQSSSAQRDICSSSVVMGTQWCIQSAVIEGLFGGVWHCKCNPWNLSPWVTVPLLWIYHFHASYCLIYPAPGPLWRQSWNFGRRGSHF